MSDNQNLDSEVPQEEEQPEQEREGVPWDKYKFKRINPGEFADHMTQLGILTYEDALKNRRKIYGVLQTMYGTDVAQLISFAREHKD